MRHHNSKQIEKCNVLIVKVIHSIAYVTIYCCELMNDLNVSSLYIMVMRG